MKDIQYTVRQIPKPLDEALRQRAKKSGKSLNETVIETLSEGTGVVAEGGRYTDMDWFIGSKMLDDNFEKNMEWLDSMPKDLD